MTSASIDPQHPCCRPCDSRNMFVVESQGCSYLNAGNLAASLSGSSPGQAVRTSCRRTLLPAVPFAHSVYHCFGSERSPTAGESHRLGCGSLGAALRASSCGTAAEGRQAKGRCYRHPCGAGRLELGRELCSRHSSSQAGSSRPDGGEPNTLIISSLVTVPASEMTLVATKARA